MVQRVAVKREFTAGLRHATTGKLSLSPSSKWIHFFELGKAKAAKRRGMHFHQLCPRYSGTLTHTAPTAISLWETFTFNFVTSYSVYTFNITRR